MEHGGREGIGIGLGFERSLSYYLNPPIYLCNIDIALWWFLSLLLENDNFILSEIAFNETLWK